MRAEDISSDVANNQQTLLDFYAGEETNPFAGLNNNSDYKQVESKASEILAQVQPEYEKLSKELADTAEYKKNESLSSQPTKELTDNIEDKKAQSLSSQSTTVTSGSKGHSFWQKQYLTVRNIFLIMFNKMNKNIVFESGY